MSGPDLSFIDVDISLEKIKPLEAKRVAAYVNNFLMKAMRILSDFAGAAEKKIVEMENRMSRVEDELWLLEVKLDSIPNLKVSPAGGDTKVKAVGALEMKQSNFRSGPSDASICDDEAHTETEGKDANELPLSSQVLPNEQTQQSSEQLDKNIVTFRNDPRYAKYFKMLKMGVLEGAIKQKMNSEGLDPGILDIPDAPSDFRGEEVDEQKAHSNCGESDDSESASFKDSE